jgi:hypothetical protein
MNKYVTTITIIHEAESKDIAHRDASIMQEEAKKVLYGAHLDGKVGKVSHVSLYSVRDYGVNR